MGKKAIDRRILRTRSTLQHALLALLRKKRYETITVQNICDGANVGRSTFYAHYTSKDDLKRSGLEHLRKLLVEQQRSTLSGSPNFKDRQLGFSLALFEHARAHVDLYRALVGNRGGTVALSSIRGMIRELVLDEISATSKTSSAAVPREFVVQFVVGAYMEVLTWWLDHGAKLAPEQMDAMFRRLAIGGIDVQHS